MRPRWHISANATASPIYCQKGEKRRREEREGREGREEGKKGREGREREEKGGGEEGLPL